jgi:hypothetical protein
MKRIITLAILLISTSCSVKKQVTKSESSTKVETDITKTEVETINTTTSVDTDTYEVEVIAKDSLQPITIVLNGVTQTFSGASKVVLRKRKEAIKQEESKSTESKDVLSQNVVDEKVDLDKSVKRSNYSSLALVGVLIVVFLLAFGYLRKLGPL